MFPPFFGEDLDTKVIVFVGSVNVVVAIDLAIQDDGGGSRSVGLAGHLEFILRNGLEAEAGLGLPGWQQGNCTGRD